MKRSKKNRPHLLSQDSTKLCAKTPTKMTIAIAAGVMLLATGQAPAQALTDEEMLASGAGLHGSIGLGVGVRPEYEGSGDKKVVPLPHINLLYGDRLFLIGMTAGVNMLHLKTEQGFAISAGPLLALRGGRDEGDNSALSGLGDIDQGLDAGGFVRFRLRSWQAIIDVRKNVRNSGEGATANLSVGHGTTFGPKLRLRASFETTWASADYMKTFFSIDALQSARSGLAQYEAASGFKDVGLRLGADYSISRHWASFVTLHYKRLLADAADSPIVANLGEANQVFAGAGIKYRF